MRVRKVRLKDFRGFEDETLDLDRPLTVLIGTNGAGKTSVLDALTVVASHLVARWTNDPSRARSFTVRDLRSGVSELSVQVDAVLFGQTCVVDATHHADPARGTEIHITPGEPVAWQGLMEHIRTATRHVTGIDPRHGGSGDPSPFTALGVRRGIEACVSFRLGRNSLTGVHVAVQGVGHVGYHLCKELHVAGATLTVADVDDAKAARVQSEFGAKVVPIDRIFDVEADVLAPCALGSALNDDTIPRLKVPIVAGAANNQLAEPRHGEALRARDISYAPDYAINAGGLVNVAQEVLGYDANASREKSPALSRRAARSRGTRRPGPVSLPRTLADEDRSCR